MTGSNWKPAAKPIACAILPAMLLAGCATRSTIPITGTVDAIPCDAMPAITYSAKSDTPETKEQVRRFNAVRDAICGK